MMNSSTPNWYTASYEVIQRRLYLRDGLPHLCGQPARGAFLAQSRGDGDVGLVVGDNVLHAVILRSVLIYLDEHTGSAAYDLCELDYFGSELCHNYLSYPFFVSIPEYDYS